MTPTELEEFFGECPTLYHMAMADSWEMIQKHGLLPTESLLSLLKVDEARRLELTRKRRPQSVDIICPEVGHARIRDQIPLLDQDLERCLGGDLTPPDWHKRLNERVFFWTSEQRLRTLMCAGAYRKLDHLVLELPTEAVFANYAKQIELSPMNSGCTRPFAHPRGPDTFLPIEEYRYTERRRRSRKGDRVVEVTVIGGIPDIAKYVTRAAITSCDGDRKLIFPS